MRQGARWLIVAVILVVAGVVAIWPREQKPVSPPEPDLTSARAEAALPPCPVRKGPVPAGLADLADVRAECLADGADTPVAGVLAGRPVLVNVWATWCDPCKAELPVLAEYAAAPGAVDVVALAVESQPADALELLTALGVKLPSLVDEPGAAKRVLKPLGLPASYVVGSDGSVRLVRDPRVFRSVAEVGQAVAGLS